MEDAVLVVSLRDQASAQAQTLLKTLDKLNVSVGGTDKSFLSAEQSVAKAATSLGGFNSQAKSTNSVLNANRANMQALTASVAEYQAALARLNVTQDSNGISRTAGGKFASKADIQASVDATQKLAAAQSALAVETQRNNALEPFEAKRMQSLSSGAGNAGRSLEDLIARSNSTRYALYSASNALTTFGTTLLALPAASAILAANYQRDFATVERATLIAGKQAVALKAALVDLSTTVPVSFKNITEIAAAGAQLGIEPSGLVNFTRVVSELTATTNLSAEAAENFLGKFAKIAGVPQSQFVNLASAILNVGVHTAATESQIAKLSTQLVGVGREAGFTVPQLIGLSGALASVSSVGPELARGTVTRFVQDVQKAVTTGGPALESFAQTAGVSVQKVRDAFGTSAFAGVFQKFINGVDSLQESGGNAVKALNDIGITSVRDVPLLLNLAAGHQTLADAIKLANDGYANSDILAQHYAKINDTLISKVKELGNSFAKFLDTIGTSSTGPLKQLADNLQTVLDGFTQFASTDSGQSFLIVAAAVSVLVGALALLGGALARIYAGIQAATAGYVGLKKVIDGFTAAQVASADASVLGVSKFRAFTAFLTGPWGLGIAAAVTALLLLQNVMDNLKTPDEKFNNIISSANLTFGKLSAAGKAGNGGVFGANPFGKDLDSQFQNFSSTLDKSEARWKNYWSTFGNASQNISLNQFNQSLKDIGTHLGEVAQSNLPAAQNGFAQLAARTNGTRDQLWFLLTLMPDYQKELTRELTISGQAATKQALLKLAYGGTGDAALDTAGKAKILTDEIDRQRRFQSDLLDATGMSQKQIDDYGTAYAKSIQPLTDFNSIVGQVQQSLSSQAQAQADAYNATIKGSGQAQKASTDFYDGTSVSLAQFTDQLNQNNQTQATWFQNIITVATQYGNAASSIFISAGYSAVNASILQQLVDATPEQAQAYIDAQTTAAEQAAAATGEALISAGVLVTSAGQTIGKDTAEQMGKMLLAGFSPADIMKHFNLIFNDNPATPAANIDPAKSKILSLTEVPYPNITISVLADTSPFQRAIANAQIQANQFASGAAYNTTPHWSGGYTGPGGKYQPAGIVHAGEFVMTAEATRRIGIGTLYALMSGSRNAQSLTPRGAGYASGGLVSPAGFSSLDAASLQAIMALANRPIFLYASDRVIAESAARGNTQIAYGGGD